MLLRGPLLERDGGGICEPDTETDILAALLDLVAVLLETEADLTAPLLDHVTVLLESESDPIVLVLDHVAAVVLSVGVTVSVLVPVADLERLILSVSAAPAIDSVSNSTSNGTSRATIALLCMSEVQCM